MAIMYNIYIYINRIEISKNLMEMPASLASQTVIATGSHRARSAKFYLRIVESSVKVSLRTYSISPPLYRGPNDHINIRISDSGSKAQSKGDTRNHVW